MCVLPRFRFSLKNFAILPFYVVGRKHDLLAQEVGSAGYKEKAPLSIQEEQMKKLNSYLEELKIVDEAEQDLERRIQEEQ